MQNLYVLQAEMSRYKTIDFSRQTTVARHRSQWGLASGQKFTASGLPFPLLLIGRGISLKAAFWCYHYILTCVHWSPSAETKQ
jgi:hypothetical protein